MNKQEAYSILGIPSTSTPEEAKKRYRDLSKTLHPDVCKEPDAELRFKKINEAYDIVSGKSVNHQPQQSHYRNPFGRQTNNQPANIDVSISVSFKESVLGVKKDIKFNRQAKCNNCNGNGEYQINNGCDKCNGRGQITTRQGNMIFTRTCDKCHGRTQSEHCVDCNGSGLLDVETSVNVAIPGGIQDNNILRLGGMGNYVGSWVLGDQHTDAHLRVNVMPEQGLSIDGMNVVSHINISLIEALSGCQKNIRTIDGDQQINIAPMSKNKEEVIIP